MTKSILIIALIHVFASLAWSKQAAEITDGLLYYTDQFGARTSIAIEDVENIYHEVYQIPVPDNASAELKEEIRLRNLENSWLHGRHYIRIGREQIQIDLAQSIEIVRARQMKDEPTHPNSSLTDAERLHLSQRIEEAKAAVKSQRSSMDSQIPKSERKVATTEVEKIVADTVAKGGSVWTLVMDGIPYFLNNLNANTLMTYNVSTRTAEVSSREVLSCNLQTTPPTGNGLRLKLNGDTNTFYASLAGSLNINPGPSTRVITANTSLGNSFCTTGPSDRIFTNGFESGGVQ